MSIVFGNRSHDVSNSSCTIDVISRNAPITPPCSARKPRVADEVIAERQNRRDFVAFPIHVDAEEARVRQMLDQRLHVLSAALFAQFGENSHARGVVGVPSMNVATELAIGSLRSS